MHDTSNEPVKVIFARVVKEDDVGSLVNDPFYGVLEENRDVDHHLGQFITHFHLPLVDLEDQAEQEVRTDGGIDVVHIEWHGLYFGDPLIECQHPSCWQDEFGLNIILGGVVL